MARGRRKRRSPLRRAVDAAGAFVVLALVAIAAALLDQVPLRQIEGRPRVVDGDTVAFSGQRVRLLGIDAPELHQTCRGPGGDYACGTEAKHYLARLIGSGRVACDGARRDRYGRLLMRCEAGGVDVNAAMVRAGWAVSYNDYGAEERAARLAKAGLWAGTFERPEAWRAARGDMASIRPANVVSRLAVRVKSMLGWDSGKGNQ